MRDDGRFARTPPLRFATKESIVVRSDLTRLLCRSALAATALGFSLVFAATAAADDDDYTYGPDNDLGLFEPDTYASPATDWVPWVQDVPAVAPQVDNSVVCDGCAG